MQQSTSTANRAGWPCTCEYCLSNMPVVDAPRTWSDIEPLVSQLEGVNPCQRWCLCESCRNPEPVLPNGIAVSADFSSATHATLTMSPADLFRLVRLARVLTHKQGMYDYLAQTVEYIGDLAVLTDVANVNIPSDSF